LYYFFRAAWAAPGLAFAAGFAFAAIEVTPSTDSFSALAGVKRSRGRAGILICSPVGIAPEPCRQLALAKDAQSGEPERAFLLQLAQNQHIELIEGLFGVFPW
jgi:hypothetical protein